mmetsp:Transcript_3944/g.6487  ORF Transcript_3944/g.6487 Transcript_3944/m.6487 type:complete len:209 (-) Transcript_3944:536-1162(-)
MKGQGRPMCRWSRPEEKSHGQIRPARVVSLPKLHMLRMQRLSRIQRTASIQVCLRQRRPSRKRRWSRHTGFLKLVQISGKPSRQMSTEKSTSHCNWERSDCSIRTVVKRLRWTLKLECRRISILSSAERSGTSGSLRQVLLEVHHLEPVTRIPTGGLQETEMTASVASLTLMRPQQTPTRESGSGKKHQAIGTVSIRTCLASCSPHEV